LIDFLANSILETSISDVFQDWVAKRVHLKVSQNILNIELGEWQNLWWLIFVKVFFLKYLPTIFVNNVSKIINKVSFGIDLPSVVVSEISILISKRNDLSIGVLVNHTNNVRDVEPASVVVIELWQVSILLDV
jgi:hypothetical protein